jgi:DnaJ-class molecular chaperone
MKLSDMGLGKDEIEKIRAMAKIVDASGVNEIYGACFPCSGKGTQLDKEGKTVPCPRCRGTGGSVRPTTNE